MSLGRRFNRLAVASLAAALVVSTCTDEPQPTEPRKAAVPGPTADVTEAVNVLVGASDIASCSNNFDEATALLLDGIDGTVVALGDNAYSSGTLTEYNTCYEPTWGRHKARTRPTPGDRDYLTSGASGYFQYFGAAAGDPSQGYYSYDVGDWHVVVLNSKIAMKAGSAQDTWLKNDLAASTKLCTVAYWHHPRFYSTGSGVSSLPLAAWQALYASGADVVLNGHQRFYERFAPQTPTEVADPAYGIREFIVGTGGAGTNSLGTPRPNSEVRNTGTRGVLKLTLDAASYSWEFVPVAGKTFTDAGTAACHGPPPPVAKPGGPYQSEASVQFDGTASSDPQGDTPLTYAWDFGDGNTGSGATPTHTYTADGAYTVTLTVTDSKGNASDPATTTATIQNLAPKVNAGPVKRAQPGGEVRLDIRFTDPGGTASDAPYAFTIAWGDGTQDEGSVESEPILRSHAYAAEGTYPVQVAITDKDGGTGSDSLTTIVEPTGTPQVLVGAGDIADGDSKNRDELTARIIDATPGTVFTFGDNAYPNGRAIDYTSWYVPTWGRHKDRTYANLGNHEYDTGNADASFDYFGGAVGPRGKGYYSFDLGDWHVIVLNDNSTFVPFAAGSVQDQWLQSDLAANTKLCTLAIWHQPLTYSSRSTGATTLRSSRKILWDRLYAAGVELVLNGHQHQYERFARQTPDRVRDDATGIRQLIVGTGGESAAAPNGTIAPNSEIRSGAFGVIKLTLRADGYDWVFVPIAGETFTDSGSELCH